MKKNCTAYSDGMRNRCEADMANLTYINFYYTINQYGLTLPSYPPIEIRFLLRY